MAEFNEVIRQYDKWIRKVAFNMGRRSRLYDRDDVRQEILIAIWRVCEKYPEANGPGLRALITTSVSNAIATCFRRDLVQDMYQYELPNAGEEHHEMGEDDYRLAIVDAIADLNETDAEIVRREVRPWSGSRRWRTREKVVVDRVSQAIA